MKNLCCKAPFLNLQIYFNGDCYICCPDHLKSGRIGNIFEQGLDDIWYGESAKHFRDCVVNNDYSLCNTKVCRRHLYEFSDDDLIKNYGYPKNIELAYVSSCNVRCITCRKDYCFETKDSTAKYDTLIEKLLPALSHAEKVFLNGSGELFASPPRQRKHTIKL